MAAFRLAKEKGAPGVELDIHLTADGKLIVIHDHTTTRVAPGTSLNVEESTTAQLQAVDIGSWKGAQWKGERPPLLSELFEELGKDLYFDVEIKSGKAEDKGLEAALAKLLADFRYGAERIVVSSFNPIAIKRFKALCPRVPTAIIYCIDDGVPPYLRRGEGRWIGHSDFLKPKHTQATKAGLAWGRLTGGRKVIPWTIDDPAIAERVLTIGCDGVISNMPHKLGLPGFN
jgi:glycerophosphoryl diester phosphodiesterase